MSDLPAFAPVDSLANEGDLPKTIVKDGKVDPDALAKLEGKGNAELSATADFIAGKFEFEHGNIDQARRYFDSALRFQPENSTVLIYYAALLVRTGNASQALYLCSARGERGAPVARCLHRARLRAAGLRPHQRSRCFMEAFSRTASRSQPSSNTWRKRSASKTSRPISPSAKAAISSCTTRASRLPKHSADRS